jgi:hypothetical protein
LEEQEWIDAIGMKVTIVIMKTPYIVPLQQLCCLDAPNSGVLKKLHPWRVDGI